MNGFLKAALAALLIAPAAGTAQEGGAYILATASTGGTYYPVGVAISTLVKVKLENDFGIGLSAVSSAGSGENVRLLRDDEAQFAILQGLYGYFAANGTGPLESDGKQENVMAVTALWPNVEHFVVASDKANTGTMADFIALKGESMALGARNSGSIGSTGEIMTGLGVDIYEDYSLVEGGYGPAADALQNGQVEGISTPAGVPVSALSQLFAAAGDGVTLLTFTPEEATEGDGGRNLWVPYDIPAGTYPGQDYDVTTIAQPNFLAVSADIPEEHVYMITKAIYENLPFLQAIHPATSEMSLETALGGLPMRLHPGAARYYEEAGVEIPERLMPQ